MKLNSWLETGLDGDVLLTPYVPKGITGYDDDDASVYLWLQNVLSQYLHTLVFSNHTALDCFFMYSVYKLLPLEVADLLSIVKLQPGE